MIEKINFTYEEAEDQTNNFTSNHIKYNCQIEYNSNRKTFSFQCNPNYNKPTLKNVLGCIISDSNAVDNTEDLADFLYEFGYNDNADILRQGIKAYDGCLTNSLKLHYLFTDEEIEELTTELEDYI